MLIFSLFQIRKRCEEVAGFIRRDPRVPLLIKANVSRFNYFVASTFQTLEDYIKWQEKYTQNFQACIEVKRITIYLQHNFFNKTELCLLELIKKKLELIQGEEQDSSHSSDGI
jgi:hypothetical protein